MPVVNKSFDEYKANTAGLIILSLFCAGSEDDAAVKKYITTYKAKYPCISAKSGGSTVFNNYKLQYVPHLMLIDPTKKVVEKDITYTDLATVLKKYPIGKTALQEQHGPSAIRPFTIDLASCSRIKLSGASAGNYSFFIYGIDGTLVNSIRNCMISNGTTTLQLPVGAAGTYLLRTETQNASFTNMVVIPR